LKRAIELNPKHGEAYYNRGVVYLSLGDHKRAADDMRTAARLGQAGARQVLKSLGLGC
jgi:Flp pilus assembly protein TadD